MPVNAFYDGDLPVMQYARIMAYGLTGVGKSALGGTMPGGRVVIATDPNAAMPLRQQIPRVYTPPSDPSRKPTIYYVVNTWQDASAVLDQLESILHHKQRDVTSLIIDNVTNLQEYCKYELLGGSPGMTARDQLYKQDYGQLFLRLDGLRHRVEQLPMHVLWLAGTKQHTEGEGATARRILQPDLVGQSATQLPAHCSAMLYVERSLGVAGRSEVRVRTVTPSSEAYHAKDNTGTLAHCEVPDMMVILAKMGYLPTAEAEAILSAVPRVAAVVTNNPTANAAPAGDAVVL